MPGNTFQKIGFLIQNTESKTTMVCLFWFQEKCVYKQNQHLPLGAHFFGSIDPDVPTADTSELQQTSQDILILEVWKITWNLKFPNTSCLYLFILFNQDHTF